MRIGVDVGGTKIEAIALDAAGRELKRIRTPTPRGDHSEAISTIQSLVQQIEGETKQVDSVDVAFQEPWWPLRDS